MSLDALGRVVVGSGHFMEGAPKALEALGSVLSALDRIVVGGGHDQSFETAKRIGEAVEHFFLPIPAPTPEVIRAPASNVPHYSDFMQQVQHKVREATRAQKIAEATMLADRRSLSLLGEAGQTSFSPGVMAWLATTVLPWRKVWTPGLSWESPGGRDTSACSVSMTSLSNVPYGFHNPIPPGYEGWVIASIPILIFIIYLMRRNK